MTKSKTKKLFIVIILIIGIGLGIFAILQESGFFETKGDAFYHFDPNWD